MNSIIEYLKETYHPDCIIIYGSYADGTNNKGSDFDALVIADCDEMSHDTSMINGVRADVFIYPPSAFEDDYDREEIIQIFDGKIILDKDGFASGLIEDVRAYVSAKAQKTKEELDGELAWCRKMLLRSARRDAEGTFRLHWLLTDSLEIFCDAAKTAYFGPKKSLKFMENNYPDAYVCYTEALSKFSLSAAERWIECIEKMMETR